MNKGFSLVELLVTVAIVGILAAVAIPQYKTFLIRTRRTAVLSFLDIMGKVEKAYLAANDEFLPTLAQSGCNLSGSSCHLFTGNIVGTFNTLDPLLDLYGVQPFLMVMNNKAMNFDSLGISTFYAPPNTTSPCASGTGDPGKVCGYTIRIFVDQDHTSEPVNYTPTNRRFDTFLLKDNTPLSFNSSWTGPNDGRAYLFIDDILDARLY